MVKRLYLEKETGYGPRCIYCSVRQRNCSWGSRCTQSNVLSIRISKAFIIFKAEVVLLQDKVDNRNNSGSSKVEIYCPNYVISGASSSIPLGIVQLYCRNLEFFHLDEGGEPPGKTSPPPYLWDKWEEKSLIMRGNFNVLTRGLVVLVLAVVIYNTGSLYFISIFFWLRKINIRAPAFCTGRYDSIVVRKKRLFTVGIEHVQYTFLLNL